MYSLCMWYARACRLTHLSVSCNSLPTIRYMYAVQMYVNLHRVSLLWPSFRRLQGTTYMWADFVIHAYVSHEVYVICNIMVSNWLKTVIFNNKKTLNRQLVITTYILIGTVKIHCRMFCKIDSCHIIYIIFKIYHSLGFSILLTPNIYSIYHVDKFYCKLIFNTSLM